jgi:hypothetical protein
MDAQPDEEKVQKPVADATDPQADVEGHSVFSAIVTSGALRARTPAEDRGARNKADEVLPPLTKRFPSMRDDRRK